MDVSEIYDRMARVIVVNFHMVSPVKAHTSHICNMHEKIVHPPALVISL